MRPLHIITPLVLVACGRLPVVAADPSGEQPVAGDTNGDGRVDLSDGLLVLRAQMAGGPPAVCMGAADVLRDNRVDLADAFAVWYHLYAGTTSLTEIAPGFCDTLDTLPRAPEGRMALEFEADRKVKASSFEATVTLASPDLAVEGWSLAAVAEGCTITGATVAGTQGADLRDSPAGARDGGFERTEVVDGVASSAVALGWKTVVALDPSEDPAPLLTLTVEADGGDCQTCTLRLEDGHATGGEPVTNLVSVAGRSYRPELPTAEIKVCPP